MATGNGGRKPPSPEYEQRVTRAIALHRQGLTYEQIAGECGWGSRSGAYRAIWSRVGAEQSEAVEELRNFATAQCLEELLVLEPKASSGDVEAIGARIRVRDQLLKIHGGFAPTLVEHSGAMAVTVDEIDAALKAGDANDHNVQHDAATEPKPSDR